MKYQAFMMGRYGQDKLSLHMCWLSLLICFVSMFVWRIPLLLIYSLLLLLALFRTFSRNIPKRQKEGLAYERFLGKIKGFSALQKNKWRDRKTHRYFKCTCGAVLRVPKGKGFIIIHCPKCKNDLTKKT